MIIHTSAQDYVQRPAWTTRRRVSRTNEQRSPRREAALSASELPLGGTLRDIPRLCQIKAVQAASRASRTLQRSLVSPRGGPRLNGPFHHLPRLLLARASTLIAIRQKWFLLEMAAAAGSSVGRLATLFALIWLCPSHAFLTTPSQAMVCARLGGFWTQNPSRSRHCSAARTGRRCGEARLSAPGDNLTIGEMEVKCIAA